MKNNRVEKKYPRFFSAVVRIFLVIMLAAFTFNIAEITADKNKAETAGITAVNGGELPESLSGSFVVNSIRLLSGSLIFAFSYLAYLFFRERERLYFLITFFLVLIIILSAVSAVL